MCNDDIKIKENSLMNYPHLVKEWNYEKNRDLKPEDFTKWSHKKVWWKCEREHEWNASISSRTKGSNCPYCSNNKILKGCNDLATTNPELLKEWSYNKNIIKPTEVTKSSGKKVWWKCNLGHQWEAVIVNRTNGNNCPYCSNNKILIGYNDLATTNPELLKEWNYNKNIISPTEVTKGSNKKVWWVCKKGHEWKAIIYTRNSGVGCPICRNKQVLKGYNDLATTNPELLKEWNYNKNIIKPTEVVKYSNKKVWWICEKGHEWEAVIANHTKGIGCPVCSNKKVLAGYNDLTTTNPNLLKEWNYNKNIIEPTEVTKSSGKKIWWICAKNHEWQTSLSNRNSGNGCPVCIKDKKISFPEKAIYFYTKQLFPDAIENYKNKNILGKREFDIYIPSLKLAIEYDGKYYHKNEKKDKIKDNICKKYNITLIRIVEKEPKCKNEFTVVRKLQTDLSLNESIKSLICIINRIFNINIDIDINVALDRIAILELINLRELDSSIKNTTLEEEWNYNKNGKLKPEMFSSGSGKKLWWKCKLGHEWEATIIKRSNGRGCPYCSNKKVLEGYNDLITTNPELAKEWNYSKNTIKPMEVVKGSNKKVWWKCSKCNYEYERIIVDKVKNPKCPSCKFDIIKEEE